MRFQPKKHHFRAEIHVSFCVLEQIIRQDKLSNSCKQYRPRKNTWPLRKKSNYKASNKQGALYTVPLVSAIIIVMFTVKAQNPIKLLVKPIIHLNLAYLCCL